MLAFAALTLSLVSCSKEEDNPSNATHYMPLAIGNSWEYKSAYYGDYTSTVTGKEKVNGFEYFVCTTSLNTTGKSYVAYEGNKLFTHSVLNGEAIRMQLLDEDAKVGDTWKAGELIKSVPNSYTSNTTYNAQYVAHHDSYKVNDKTYSDVIELKLITTASIELNPLVTAGMDQEDIEFIKAFYESALAGYNITQQMFYAKNVGLIYQFSDDQSALGIELSKYTIK
jgi:hypothetical protein